MSLKQQRDPLSPRGTNSPLPPPSNTKRSSTATGVSAKSKLRSRSRPSATASTRAVGCVLYADSGPQTATASAVPLEEGDVNSAQGGDSVGFGAFAPTRGNGSDGGSGGHSIGGGSKLSSAAEPTVGDAVARASSAGSGEGGEVLRLEEGSMGTRRA